MKVWIVEGYFGDTNWLEAIYKDQDEVDKALSYLMTTRNSERGPQYCAGLHKFDCWEEEVLEKFEEKNHPKQNATYADS